MKKDYFTMLENRFGAIDTGRNVVDRFGKKYFDGIIGWQFPKLVVAENNSEGKLLTMDLDIPCTCKLDCIYCFAKEDAYYRPQAGNKPLTFREIKQCLREAKKIGLQSAKIVGFGEPFENPEIFDFIEFTSSLDIQLVIFTSAYTLGKHHFDGDLDDVIEFLYEHKVSLMVKYHTVDHDKEVMIARQDWYPQKRDAILRRLLEYGKFNATSPTRLGIENVIATQNVEELTAIYEYFKIFRNVHTDIDPPIPVGRTATQAQCQAIGMNETVLLSLYKAIYKLNREFQVPFLGYSPFIGNAPCSQLPNGIYLTLSGKVMSCCGGNQQYGDLNKGDSIRDCFLHNPYRLKTSASIYHRCPYREKAGILTQDFFKQLNSDS